MKPSTDDPPNVDPAPARQAVESTFGGDGPPLHIGAYSVVDILSAGRTFLAERAGRRVVLKRLDSDCLSGPEHRRLHATVRDRLARVRELADLHVAHLYGVEQIGDDVYLIWDFIDGESIESVMMRSKSSDSMRHLVRELLLAVQSLHARGLVHGTLHAGNVLVDRAGRIRLIDLSPLLFTDVRHDAAAVMDLLRGGLALTPATDPSRRAGRRDPLPGHPSARSSNPSAGWRRQWGDSIAVASKQPFPLEWLRVSLTASSEPSTDEEDVRARSEGRRDRRRAIVRAAALAVLGVLAAVVIASAVRG